MHMRSEIPVLQPNFEGGVRAVTGAFKKQFRQQSRAGKCKKFLGCREEFVGVSRAKNRWPEAVRFRHFREQGSGKWRSGYGKVFAFCHCQKRKTPSLRLRLRSENASNRLIQQSKRTKRFYRYTGVLPARIDAERLPHVCFRAAFKYKQALTRIRFYRYTQSSIRVTTNRAAQRSKEAR
jgi:hypothetical protein